jgi:hypothetical protein
VRQSEQVLTVEPSGVAIQAETASLATQLPFNVWGPRRSSVDASREHAVTVEERNTFEPDMVDEQRTAFSFTSPGLAGVGHQGQAWIP